MYRKSGTHCQQTAKSAGNRGNRKCDRADRSCDWAAANCHSAGVHGSRRIQLRSCRCQSRLSRFRLRSRRCLMRLTRFQSRLRASNREASTGGGSRDPRHGSREAVPTQSLRRRREIPARQTASRSPPLKTAPHRRFIKGLLAGHHGDDSRKEIIGGKIFLPSMFLPAFSQRPPASVADSKEPLI